MISCSDALALVSFTRDEERAVAKIEAAIDAALRGRFDGAPTRLEFKERILPKLAHAVQRRYEDCGWRVNVAVAAESCAFVFAPAPGKTATVSPDAPALPSVVAYDQPTDNAYRRTGPRLLVRMPTRGRPKQALDVLLAYRTKAGTDITIEVVIDEDDQTMLACDVLQRMVALGCVVTVGRHRNKVEAVNGGRVDAWDVLLLASDDMVPVVDGYATRVLSAMQEHFPYLDGAIFFDDGFQGGNLCTLPILGRRFYDQFGYVYHPAYKSLFCDTEQTELYRAMGRLAYVDEKIIEHRHPAWGKAAPDALYARNDALWNEDQYTYERRKQSGLNHSQFAFLAPPLWLSICVATLPARKTKLLHLLDHLYAQTVKHEGRVEILVDSREDVSVGVKRQALLARARGHYVSFVDDDDWVAHDYVARVLHELMNNGEPVDCVAIEGEMTTAGAVVERFNHSIKNECKTVDGVHFRTPNHLNPVRRELALAAGFNDMTFGEDHDYATRLFPLLKTEGSVGPAPLYFYWYWPGKDASK